jgi:hypothetical protein
MPDPSSKNETLFDTLNRVLLIKNSDGKEEHEEMGILLPSYYC